MFLDSNGPFLNVLEEQDITLILVDVFFFCYFFFFGGGGGGGYERYLFECN